MRRPEGSAGYLIQEMVAQMTALMERRPGFARGVIFRWISAHSGVPGNEKADIRGEEGCHWEILPSRTAATLSMKGTAQECYDDQKAAQRGRDGGLEDEERRIHQESKG